MELNSFDNFHVTKTISAADLPSFVKALNQQTRDAYVADIVRVGLNMWFLRVTCSRRDDVDLVRGL